MADIKRALLPALLALIIAFNLAATGMLFLDLTPASPAAAAGGEGHPAATVSAGGGPITVTVRVHDRVHVGEPFVYEVRVSYDPASVAPDFRKFIRDIRFVPFEQQHLTRPTMVESTLPAGKQEYLISYQVLGVNVIPHGSYTLDPVQLSYRDLAADKIKSLTVQPGPVQIGAYHPRDFFSENFQPLKGRVEAYHGAKQAAIAANAVLLLILGGGLLYHSARRRGLRVLSGADLIRDGYEAVQAGPGNRRQGILSYETLLLSLLWRYRGLSARGFWLGRARVDAAWDADLKDMKDGFRAAYRAEEPERGAIASIKAAFERVFGRLEADSARERTAEFERMQGTAWQRMSRRKAWLAGGAASLALAVFSLVLLLRPGIWINADAVYFNQWIDLIPEKFLDEDRNDELESVDLELLGYASEQHQTMEKLQGEVYKSAYLYNYGTIIAKTNLAILTSGGDDEEEIEEDEMGEPPSFEVPVQFLANAVRFFPYDEDARRNLELAILYRENEKKDESGEVQGEIGPPLPGFSRDMNEVLF